MGFAQETPMSLPTHVAPSLLLQKEGKFTDPKRPQHRGKVAWRCCVLSQDREGVTLGMAELKYHPTPSLPLSAPFHHPPRPQSWLCTGTKPNLIHPPRSLGV